MISLSGYGRGRFVLAFLMLLSALGGYAQEYRSLDNHTGFWETAASWDPYWPVPDTVLNNTGIAVYGYLTASSSLSFNGTNKTMYIYDTLVVRGDLILGSNITLFIHDGAILIVRGDLVLDNKSLVTADGTFIITGNILKSSSVNQGAFISNDNPARVFLAGSISAVGITDNNPGYPVLNQVNPTLTVYPGSTYPYGNMEDLANDPVFDFFQRSCLVAEAFNSGPLCEGKQLQLHAGGGVAWEWSGPGGFSSTLRDPVLPAVTPADSGTYRVIMKDAGGCTIVHATRVEIRSTPEVHAGSDTTVTGGTTLTLKPVVTGDAPFAYSWTPQSLLTDATIERPTTLPLDSTALFRLSATSLVTGCSASDEFIITVSGGPLAANPLATAPVMCAGEQNQLYALAGGGSGFYTYVWTSVPSGFTSTEANPWVSPLQNTLYSAVVSDGSTSVTAQVSVVVHPLPDPPVLSASGTVVICNGDSIMLSTSGGHAYEWSDGSSAPVLFVHQSGTYSVRVADAYGCFSTPSQPVTTVVHYPVPVTITSGVGAMCLNGERALAATPAGGTFTVVSGPGMIQNNVLTAADTGSLHILYTFSNGCVTQAAQSIPVTPEPKADAGADQELFFASETRLQAMSGDGETGSWSLLSGSGVISDPASPATTVSELGQGDNIFVWTAQAGACMASDEVKVTVSSGVVPSVITPNGDGRNDYFRVAYDQGMELSVFNPWGGMEYQTDHYENEWGGKDLKGRELPEGTYYYLLKLENGTVMKGFIYIKR